ncbi:hypothetical protein NNJEOMEG_01520 [Fundidesulfovibrio magnetotacticus]|uniref:SAF domain-containing protein n=1 Tax=Fundidesulfovibrio magnetotacticus TaxID=2730080 RepID=A0A6V8LV38_9BACT|nr:Flp pilus assembly protein CpaB [Fundidesulfovibrio magnetotacticus]GFK93686.1 hypothetical protein NNJEOMEG_01520 [Fundidesulfovibrio magnetotacticus]
MNRSRILLHGAIALVLSLTAGFLVFSWLQGQGKKRQAPVEQAAPAQVQLAVAAKPLARGERLGPGNLSMAPYFEKSVPPGSFTALDALEGRVVMVPLGVNEPVTQDKLFPAGSSGSGLETRLGEGRRALAVRGNRVMGLGGLILPGARVDVLMTVDDPDKQGQKLAKVILENMLVLAVGAQADRPQGGKEEMLGETYTLEATPAEAEKLALAGVQGELHLALRGPLDRETVLTSGASLRGNLASLRETDPPKDAPPDQTKAQPMVEEIRGAKREVAPLGSKDARKTGGKP